MQPTIGHDAVRKLPARQGSLFVGYTLPSMKILQIIQFNTETAAAPHIKPQTSMQKTNMYKWYHKVKNTALQMSFLLHRENARKE